MLRNSGARWQRLDRWRRLAIVFVLVLGASWLLAYWAWQASTRQHALAVALLRSQAQLAGQRYVARLVEELYVGGRALFRPVSGDRLTGAEAGAKGAERILAALPDLEACKCVSVLTPAYAFRSDLTTNGTTVAGPSASTIALPAILAAVRAHLEQLQGGWDLAVVPGQPGGDGRIVLFTNRTPPAGVVYGIGIDTAVLRRVLLRPLLSRTAFKLVDSAHYLPNDSLIALRIVDRDGHGLFSTTVPPDAALADEIRMPAEWGWTAAIVSIRAPAARAIVAGGLPKSPLPMLAALVVVAGGLLTAALVLVWRMLEVARLRADVTSGISHELRTPLTQILLYAESLSLGHHRTRTERERAVTVITREARRLLQMVENILHFSRAERRATTIHLRSCDLVSVMTDVVHSFTPLAAARGTTVQLRTSGARTGVVDEDALRRIVLNLLENAVRYGPENQVVQVRLENGHERLLLTVEDEGTGIPVEERERIWEPFARLDDSGAGQGGVGLGLAIVRDLVKRQRGSAVVESAPGGGARFVVEIPYGDRARPTDPSPIDVTIPVVVHDLVASAATRRSRE